MVMLEGYGFLNLKVLRAYPRVVLIAMGMQLREDAKTFFIMAVIDKPTRGLQRLYQLHFSITD